MTGATVSVAPAATITYTLTATDADGSVTATVTVMVGPWPNYDIAYQSGLLNGWVSANWSGNQIHPLTNFAAAAPGRTGNAIEVSFGAFDAFGMWSSSGSKFINEFHTLEFDLYVEPDSTQLESLRFIFNDSGRADDHALVDFIPGWATMTDAQRYGHWFHVAVDLNHIHLINPDLVTFLLFNNSRGMPHFHLAEVKLGWAADTTPPVVNTMAWSRP